MPKQKQNADDSTKLSTGDRRSEEETAVRSDHWGQTVACKYSAVRDFVRMLISIKSVDSMH